MDQGEAEDNNTEIMATEVLESDDVGSKANSNKQDDSDSEMSENEKQYWELKAALEGKKWVKVSESIFVNRLLMYTATLQVNSHSRPTTSLQKGNRTYSEEADWKDRSGSRTLLSRMSVSTTFIVYQPC